MSKQVFSERFEVQELIAEGGMGAVYKVLDTKLDRVAALKVVHSHLSSDADFVERFRDEARKTARLQGHPNIVQIFDVANDHGTEYLVMEYFPSTNLRDQLRSQGKFPLRDAINVTRQIAQALMKSHSCDIIHRDIKPANILLDSNQFVKLTDFGIAKALSDAPLTSTGQLIGTLKYMSPEQARNTILDGKTDLYSLGMVLYELVTGKNLWKDVPNLAIYGNLQAEATIPALNFSSDVPQGIQAVIQDLLRFDPTDRIQNAEALIARLEDLREIWEDPDATIVKPRVQEPEGLEDDKTVAVLHPPSSGPAGQKPGKQPEKLPKPTRSSPLKPKKIAIEDAPRSIDPVESNTKKTIRNSVFATIILLVIGGYYYVSTQLDTNINQKTDTVTKVIQDQKAPRTVTPEEVKIPSLDGNQTATEEARVAQEKAIATTKAAEDEARMAQAKAASEAQAAEEARVARVQAEAKAQAAEEERVAQTAAAAEAQVAEKIRMAQDQAAAESQADEEAREAQAKAAATAKANEEARIAQEIATTKAQAAEKARVTEANTATAQAVEEARVAEANAAAKAQDAEQARIAEATAAAQVEAAEKARAVEAKAVAQAKAAEKARVAKAKAAAEAKAQVQALAAEKARAAEAAAAAKAKAAEKARIAKAKAAVQATEDQKLNTLLAELQRSISKRDLKTLKAISTMSTSRQKMLENLFARYQTIETSIGDLTKTDDKATVILQFTKFVRPNGEIVQPSRFLKTTNVVIPKEANGWGLLNW